MRSGSPRSVTPHAPRFELPLEGWVPSVTAEQADELVELGAPCIDADALMDGLEDEAVDAMHWGALSQTVVVVGRCAARRRAVALQLIRRGFDALESECSSVESPVALVA